MDHTEAAELGLEPGFLDSGLELFPPESFASET